MTPSLIFISWAALVAPSAEGQPSSASTTNPVADPFVSVDATTDPTGDPSALEPGDGSTPTTSDSATPDPATAEETTGADPAVDASATDPSTSSPVDPSATSPATAATPMPTPAVVARPPADRPIRWRLDFGISGGSTIVVDPGFRAFAERRHLAGGELSAVFDFRLAEGRVFVGGGIAYQRLGRIGDAYGADIPTQLRLHEPRAIGRVSVMAVEGIDAFGRVGVGPSIVDYELLSTQAAAQRAVLPRVDGELGLSLYLPKRWLPRKGASRVTAGLNLGMGYTWRGKLSAQPSVVLGDDPLRTTSSPLGDLAMHGLSWRVGLMLRVM
ncbi:MAG: hypothetical protein K0V04_40530 [Deltaproteobacteria bacterium]|nr:hypothetical protein [Deltaproteobacteria bacterium]